MKLPVSPILVALICQRTAAHYVFSRLIVNGTISKDFQYVRDVTGNAGTRDSLWYKAFPIFGAENKNSTCGRGAFPVYNADTIETATVFAGDDVGLALSGPFFNGDSQPLIYHEGPGMIFLGKLPEGLKNLSEYDGAGDFFKIGYAGPDSATSWSLQQYWAMNATIPVTTPPGKYLLRVEQFLASSYLGQSQWFVNCAHVEIVGAGGGRPEGLVKFPGAYHDEDPSVWFREEGTESGYPKDFMKYVEPKPAAWTG
tara:strand:- start:1565 stop:2329 length:765 start_codon:yes stop_codon:yes gene_type:complete